MKYALAELVTAETPADDILNITVCEPAMGSAAFHARTKTEASDQRCLRRWRIGTLITLTLQPSTRHFVELIHGLEPDKPSVEPRGRNRGRAASGERVEHGLSFLGGQVDQIRDQSEWLLRLVKSPFVFGEREL